MQFNFNCEQILNADSQGFAVIEAAIIHTLRPVYLQIVQQIIDFLGKASAKARRGHLNYVATASFKFFKSGNERIYFKAKEDRVLGFLRLGPEKHSFRDRQSNFSLQTALVVKDFYVHESVQRKGVGKQLFDWMCEKERVPPYQFAFDSANDVLLMFLEKNYKLTRYIVQNDSLLVFEEFFSSKGSSQYYQSLGGSSIMTSRDYSLDQINPPEQQYNIYKNNSPEQMMKRGDYYSMSPSSSTNNFSSKQISSPSIQERKYFANYYLNDLLASNNNQFLEQIYKRRTPLMNSGTPMTASNSDLTQKHDQYVKEKLSSAIQGKEIINERLKQLESSITPIQKKFTDYKKRNEFSTLLDLKSVRPKEPIIFAPNYEQSFKISTPTSSGVYGYHYHQGNSYNIDGNSPQRNVFYNKQYN